MALTRMSIAQRPDAAAHEPGKSHVCHLLRTALLVLLLMPSLCLAEITDEHLDRLEMFDAWAQQAFHPRALKTLRGIRTLGPLVHEKIHAYESAHADNELELREFVFDGLAVYAVIEKAVPSQLWVTTIHVTSPAWRLENGLAVGQSVAELERLPVEPEPETLRFCGVGNCLIADERDGTISALRLELYLD